MKDIHEMIEGDLAGLDPMQRIVRLVELTEFYSRDVPAFLADMRVTEVRALADEYTLKDITAGTGLSLSRLRKLMER